MAIWDDIGNWVGGLFNPQPASQSGMFPQSEVQQAVQSGNAMATTPSWMPQPTRAMVPTTPSYPAAAGGGWGTTQSPSGMNPWLPVTTTRASTPRTTPKPGGNPYKPGTIEWMIWDAQNKPPVPELASEYQQALIKQQLWNQDPNNVGSDAWWRQQQLAQSTQEAGATASYRQQQLALQQQQIAQEQSQYQARLESEKQQRLASLAAQPKSWLEYASLSGQVPVIQPWMLPLMPQEYGAVSVGTQIPGYGDTNMGGMPSLLTPSAQLLARMGPTAQQQYYGYQQAQQGATPEETQFRLWAMAPPGGRNVGLRQQR